jgi:hypothetical protein
MSEQKPRESEVMDRVVRGMKLDRELFAELENYGLCEDGGEAIHLIRAFREQAEQAAYRRCMVAIHGEPECHEQPTMSPEELGAEVKRLVREAREEGIRDPEGGAVSSHVKDIAPIYKRLLALGWKDALLELKQALESAFAEGERRERERWRCSTCGGSYDEHRAGALKGGRVVPCTGVGALHCGEWIREGD